MSSTHRPYGGQIALVWSVVVAASLLLVSPGAPAQEVWGGAKTRVEITDGDYALPQHLQWAGEVRFDGEGIGLSFVLLRMRPSWRLGDHVRLAAGGATAVQRRGAAGFQPEVRLELEPQLVWSLGIVELENRHRLERRWFLTEQRWRYRTRIGVSLEPEGSAWSPFVSQEFFVNLDTPEFGESRTNAGVSWQDLGDSGLSLGLSYMLQLKRGDEAWDAIHIAVFEVSFGPDHPHVWDLGGP